MIALEDYEHDLEATVTRWRQEAERCMIESDSSRQGMTDEEVSEFVRRYLPAYNAYLPNLVQHGYGGGGRKTPTLLVRCITLITREIAINCKLQYDVFRLRFDQIDQ